MRFEFEPWAKPVYEYFLSILFMRFLEEAKKTGKKVIVLSILFMRFDVDNTIKVKKKVKLSILFMRFKNTYS